MFKVYDSNFKEVKIPVDRLGFGSRALEINIGPVIYENVYSQGRRADTLVKRYAKDRQVSIVLMVSGMDETDFRMKRDVLYSFFRNLGVFFVAEEQQPFKLIKVIVNDDYDIDRQTPEIAMPEIPLKIIDTPFKQSLHTTLDIDREGVRWNDKWAYGMGLSSDKAQWKYSFEPTPEMVNLSASTFVQGNIHNTGGYDIDVESHRMRIRTRGRLDTVTGTEYSVHLRVNNANAEYVRVFHFDESGTLIFNDNTMSSVGGNGSSTHTFTARGAYIRLVVYEASGKVMQTSDIGTNTFISLRGLISKKNSVEFFNAGTEEVKLIRQKESEVTLTFKTDVNSSPPSSTTEKITPVFELGGWGSQGRKITGSNPVTIRSTTALQIKSGMVTSTKSSNIYQYEYIIRSSDVEEFDGDVNFYVDRTGKIDFGTGYIAPADNYYYLVVNRKDGAEMSAADLNNIRSLFNPIEYAADANRIEIYDGETTFTLNRSVKNGDVLKLEGHKVLLNGNNVQSDTNFNFLTVKKGWNNWEIRGVSNFEFKIDYRFLYD